MYLTYAEYMSYGGNLSEADFRLAELKARKRIDLLTASRVERMAHIPSDVKLCMMSLINTETALGLEAQATNPTVTSFNTDGYSESYGAVPKTTAEIETTLSTIVRGMLYGIYDDYGVPLLYRGLDLDYVYNTEGA